MQEKKDIRTDLLELYTNDQLIEEKDVLGLSHQNLSDRIYNTIRKKIICHQVKPGERLIDSELAEELGVSRSLVRQAFTILEKAGLVELIPRNGFYVREISRQDVKEMYEIRNILETQAALMAVDKISNEDIKKVESVFEAAKEDLDTNNKVKKFIKADAILHEMLLKSAGNSRLTKLIKRYINHFIFYRIIDLSRVERAKQAYFEHYKIFEAVKQRDAEHTAELISAHISNAKDIILKNYDKYTFG